jgi:hypothetical protein
LQGKRELLIQLLSAVATILVQEEEVTAASTRPVLDLVVQLESVTLHSTYDLIIHRTVIPLASTQFAAQNIPVMVPLVMILTNRISNVKKGGMKLVIRLAIWIRNAKGNIN